MDWALLQDVLDTGFGVVLVALAGLIVYASPRGRTNQALVVFLLVYALTSLHSAAGLLGLLGDRTLSYNIAVFHVGAQAATAVAYLAFTIQAVDAPWLAPARRRHVPVALVAAGLSLVPLAFAFHESLGMTVVPVEGVGFVWARAPWAAAAYRLFALVVVLHALAASLVAFARAPRGTIARRRARSYAIAFGLQDAALALSFAFRLVGTMPPAVELALAVPTLLTPFFLAHGLIRFQLFDFDLRVKRGVARGSVVAVFVAVFIVAAELAQSVLTDSMGYLAGALAAGGLLVAVRPIERAAGRVADAAMPDVAATPAYLAFKKLEVYRAAVESALEDDRDIDVRERAMLDRLRAKLRIDLADAAAVEAEARAA